MKTHSLCFCVPFSGKPLAKHSDLVQRPSRCSHKLLTVCLPSPLGPRSQGQGWFNHVWVPGAWYSVQQRFAGEWMTEGTCSPRFVTYSALLVFLEGDFPAWEDTASGRSPLASEVPVTYLRNVAQEYRPFSSFKIITVFSLWNSTCSFNELGCFSSRQKRCRSALFIHCIYTALEGSFS